MDRQAYPEKPYDASDKDLYSAQTPPDSLHDIHTENPIQEEASFNDEAIEYNSPILDSECPDELEYAGRQRNIGFPSSQLLGQGIDNLRLSTLEPKLDAIIALEFPQTLKALGKYLGMTGLLRQYVNGYAWKAEPLHERKTLLSKNSPVKGPPRKRFATRMILEEASDPKKLESFHELQKASTKFLYHHDYGPRIRLVRREREYQERVVPGHPSQKNFLHTLPLSSSILPFSIILKAPTRHSTSTMHSTFCFPFGQYFLTSSIYESLIICYDQWYKEKDLSNAREAIRIMKERKVPGKGSRQRVVV